MIGRVLQPIEGDPDSVRALAATLTSGAARLASVNSVLVGIKAGASWDSPAGELFEAAVRESPPVIDALIDRYAGAAAALRSFAASLEEAQALARSASAARHEAHDEHRRLEECAVAAQADPVTSEQVRRRQGEAMARMMAAEQQHDRAWDAFTRADRHLAARLRTLADDILDDPWHYTAFAKADEMSQELSAIPPVARRASFVGVLAATGDAAGLASQVGLLMIYGEGSWKQLGINTGARVAGVGARGLRTGALAGSAPATRLSDGRRIQVGEKLSTTRRFVIGTREAIPSANPVLGRVLRGDGAIGSSRMAVPLDRLPAMPPTAGLPIAAKVQVWRARGVAAARRQAETAVLDDWRAATAGGRNAQMMFAAGSTLERVVPKAQAAATNAWVEKPVERARPVSAP